MGEPTQNSQTGVFNYSLLFAVLYYALLISFAGFAYEIVANLLQTNKDWLLNCGIIIICTSLVSWRFARVHRRSFSKSELWRLIAYCLFWSFGIEIAVSVYSFFSRDAVGLPLALAALSGLHSFVYIYGDLVIVYLLILWVGFGIAGKWIIQRELSYLKHN